jgi:hypothetical protein
MVPIRRFSEFAVDQACTAEGGLSLMHTKVNVVIFPVSEETTKRLLTAIVYGLLVLFKAMGTRVQVGLGFLSFRRLW